MNQDLLTQLAEYGTYCEERQGSVAADDVIHEVVGAVVPLTVPVRPTRIRRPWLVAVAAAAAVLVLVGGAALLLRVIGSDTPVATTPPIDSPSSLTWSRVPHDEAVFGGVGAQSINSVTVGGPGLVAVGSDGSGAAVWTSVDGVTWSRIPHDEAVFGGSDETSMVSVTIGGPGLVAVGWDGPEEASHYYPVSLAAAVWTSVDAVTWSRIPHDEAVFGGAGSQTMMSVTIGGPGLVAVGSSGWSGSAAPVWTSVDGVTWSRIPHDEAVFGSTGWREMMSVTVGGPGLVAVGRAGPIGDAGAAVVWTSVDGVTWSRIPHDEAVFGGLGAGMESVNVGGPGLVAVGSDGSGRAGDADVVVWTSPDGITWSRVPHDEAVFGGTMMSVITAGSGLVAVGVDSADQLSGPPVWTSVDGITWTRVPPDEAVFGGVGAQSINSVTVGGPGLVTVGSDGSGAAVWNATAKD